MQKQDGKVAEKQGSKESTASTQEYEKRMKRQDLNEFEVKRFGKLALLGKGVVEYGY